MNIYIYIYIYLCFSDVSIKMKTTNPMCVPTKTVILYLNTVVREGVKKKPLNL